MLEAAKAVFTALGIDAPVREIAERAGVGMGTLYRRFPKRSDLVAAVFRREVDACAAEAPTLASRYTPGEALAHWLRRYAGFLTTKKGLAAALHSGDPAFDALPDYFRGRFEPVLASLLDAAAAAGEVRGDVEAHDLLRAIGYLSIAAGDDGATHSARMLELLIDGMRFGASPAAPSLKREEIPMQDEPEGGRMSPEQTPPSNSDLNGPGMTNGVPDQAKDGESLGRPRDDRSAGETAAGTESAGRGDAS